MKYQVVYMSNTGNTEMIAKKIFADLPGQDKDIVRYEPNASIPEADVYFVGFWIHKGTCSMNLLEFISELHEKKIALFGTCGMGADLNYYKRLAEDVEAWIADDSECLGTFFCQGKMPMSVRNRYEEMLGQGNDKMIRKMIQNFDSALTHPDNNDLQHATEFVQRVTR